MGVRIVHAADFHMDSPFRSLPEALSKKRRAEQRALLSRLSETVKEERADLLLLSGDLFDSSAAYWETAEALTAFFKSVEAKVFVAPGNHDYYGSRSPWSYMELPDNVFVFKTGAIRPVELPELCCRVWGAGFTTTSSESLLEQFTPQPSNLIDILVMHADMNGGRYNAVTEEELAACGMDYVALGHTHTFSGIRRAGDVYYAYPGCLEGRGFDETGEKGVIAGTVGKRSVDLSFVPIPGRRYEIREADVTDREDIAACALEAASGAEDCVVRVILKGQAEGEIDAGAILSAAGGRFYHLELRDETVPKRGLWDGADSDTLTGLFLARMKRSFDEAADSTERRRIALAVRYGLAALEGREEWRP